jgi:hypothetical protein
MAIVIEQLAIPGIEEYEQKITELRSRGAKLLIEIGGLLLEAQAKFSSYPLSYWEDWLRIKFEMRPRQAKFAIEAFQSLQGVAVPVSESAMRAIVQAPAPVRDEIRLQLLAGSRVTSKSVAKLITATKTISIGSLVYLGLDSASPGGQGVVKSIDGEVVLVLIDGVEELCFKNELSLMPPENPLLRLTLSKPKTGAEMEYRFRSVVDENQLLKETIYSLWFSCQSARSQIEEMHPNVSEWGD